MPSYNSIEAHEAAVAASGGGGSTSVATTWKSLGLASPTWRDPNSLTSAHSIDANGTLNVTLDHNQGAISNPGQAAGWAVRLQHPDGTNFTRPSGVARLYTADLATMLDDSDDIYIAVLIADSADLLSGGAFGMAMHRRSASADLNVSRVSLDVGTWTMVTVLSSAGFDSASSTDARVDFSWVENSTGPRAYRVEMIDDAGVVQREAQGSLTTGQVPVTDFAANGVWLHAVAWRGTGDGVAPNDAAETVAFRALYQLGDRPFSDTLGGAT